MSYRVERVERAEISEQLLLETKLEECLNSSLAGEVLVSIHVLDEYTALVVFRAPD